MNTVRMINLPEIYELNRIPILLLQNIHIENLYKSGSCFWDYFGKTELTITKTTIINDYDL